MPSEVWRGLCRTFAFILTAGLTAMWVKGGDTVILGGLSCGIIGVCASVRWSAPASDGAGK